MLDALLKYQPPVGFYFSVNILDVLVGAAPMDAAFQEVSGIKATQQFDEIKEGGENRFAHKVPGRVQYDNLVLKRGLVVWPSPLAMWCRYRLSNGVNVLTGDSKVEPKNIMVQLLDAKTFLPIMAWFFAKAQPLSWEVGSLDAENSRIAVETLTFSYNYFKVIEGIGVTYLNTPSL